MIHASRLRPLLACLALLASLLFVAPEALALGRAKLVSTQEGPGAFPLVSGAKATPLFTHPGDWPGVLRAAGDLQSDTEKVTGKRPTLLTQESGLDGQAVIIGTLGRGGLVDKLVAEGRLDVSKIQGRWEAFLVQIVDKPLPGVPRALVVAGSDKRGTIYGIYELSEQMGVSPWAWWADVPVKKSDTLFALPSPLVETGPGVKYRGIFLNDEAPALTGWVKEKYGDYNAAFYRRVFELILRLRGNYLWPAMWSNAFNEDDPENPRLADEYGIVMGTSHHEPMIRSQQEWAKHHKGHWDYATNAEELRSFWTDGIRRNKHFESIVTLGMRGDGDLPMSEGENVALLEKIVADQRAILAEHMNPKVEQIPQLWALYKEVQGYYEKGMRVPDDVTLLWCDDNWGNIRRLPAPNERGRSGGAGVYYHFDYVGGPRSYKWLNTVPITKVWEQMNLAWQYEARRIWIVNVGDLKPMEFPIEFFLTLAWNPEAIPQDGLQAYTEAWAAREFGAAHAREVAALISSYTKFNGRRKPEQLAPETYSLIHDLEAERIVADYRALQARAEKLSESLPAEYRDAFFQLVLHPIKACAIVNELYVTAAKNKLYAVQGRSSTNAFSARTRRLFADDAALTLQFNEELGKGRWRHFADQNHLGYTYWQQPHRNAMPAVTELQIPEAAELGVSVEGSPLAWPTHDPGQRGAQLPAMNNLTGEGRWLELFNRGAKPAEFSIEVRDPWLSCSQTSGQLDRDLRVWLQVDWTKVPVGTSKGSVVIKGPGAQVKVEVPVRNFGQPSESMKGCFVESAGYLSIEAQHFSRAIAGQDTRWVVLPDHGRTLSAVTALPANTTSLTPGGASPRLEYDIWLEKEGDIVTSLLFSPTLNFQPGRGLRIAVSLNDSEPKVIDILGTNSMPEWERSVSDGVRRLDLKLKNAKAGANTLKLWKVDPAVVLQKILIDAGGLRPTYLGPRESPRVP